MPLIGRKENALDGKEVMELWLKMGSLGRVNRFFETQGRRNYATGQPYTENALWRAAAIFTIEHPADARAYYQQAGDIKSDEEWEKFVLRKAMQVYKAHRSTFMRWAISQQWPRKYEELFRDAYSIRGPEDWEYFTHTERRMSTGAGRRPRRKTAVSE